MTSSTAASAKKRASRRKKNSTWRLVRRFFVAVFALAILIPTVTFMIAYMVIDVPQPGDLRTNQVATIFAADGTSIIGKVVPPQGNRTDVEISQIPEFVRDAVISAEDRDFYSNPGFSISGFARAAKNNLTGGDTQGGSTITQQYIKNAIVGSERSGMAGYTRKAKELVMATKMAREWTKDEILAAYLNTIYFGRGAYGISAASKAYFNKNVQDLTVAEGAVLASSIQSPSGNDPEINLTRATERWNYVLDGMVTIGALSVGDRVAQVYPATISIAEATSDSSASGPEGLIKTQVLKELAESDISEQELNTEGLQIITTIDPKAQQAAVNSVNENLEGESADLRSAVVSVDPRSGAIRAYYGGSDGVGFDYAQAGLQTGSSFKVFGLVAALKQGIGLGTAIDSSPLVQNGIRISNVEGDSCGVCSIAEALKRSLNTSFYRLMLKLDGDASAVAEAAHQAGIAKSFPGVDHTLSEDGLGGPPNYGVVLGQYQSRVLDMASAYATLAASGTYYKPHFIQKVTTADGVVLLDRGTPLGEKRFDNAVADNATAAMKPIAGYSRGHNLAGGRQSAAKTGTAQLGDTGQNKDAWMVGYTPSLATAVWVGTDSGQQPLINSYGGQIYGSGLPSDIWKDTMDGALVGTENENFPKPGTIGGYSGVPVYVPPSTETTSSGPSSPVATNSSVVLVPPSIEILPGITIPLPGAPTASTVPTSVAPVTSVAPTSAVAPPNP
ncbi:MAG: transglycosylase domain-containing protein [Mycobacteriaceae bacterium]